MKLAFVILCRTQASTIIINVFFDYLLIGQTFKFKQIIQPFALTHAYTFKREAADTAHYSSAAYCGMAELE